MIRAVVDTNVFVSAQISRSGAPARVIDYWQAEMFALVINEQMLQEIERMLIQPWLKKHGFTYEDSIALTNALRKLAFVTPGWLNVKGVARDLKDDMILAAAVEGAADYIVIGDNDLLVLGSYEGIPIVSPAEFIQAVEHRQG